MSARFLLFFLIPLFIISSSSSSVDRVDINNEDGSRIAATNKFVDSICKQTSNYTFCVESIYTDPQAPKAQDYFLIAYISFGLAYLNATDTLSYIKHEEDISSSSSLQQLQRCREDYEKAVSALEEAYNDLNSETYSDLKVLANSASDDALHCSSQQVLHTNSVLRKRSADLRGLCEICVVVSNQFSN